MESAVDSEIISIALTASIVKIATLSNQRKSRHRMANKEEPETPQKRFEDAFKEYKSHSSSFEAWQRFVYIAEGGNDAYLCSS